MKFSFLSIAAVIALAFAYCFNSGQISLYIPYTLLVIILLKIVTFKWVPIFIKFLIGLFLLGNWLKVTLHGIFEYPYVEATGQFAGTDKQWDDFFSYSIVIALGLICAAFPTSSSTRVSGSKVDGLCRPIEDKTSNRFAVALILIIYALNWEYGFYRVGVARELYLPFGLDAPASFMVYLGAPMIIAILAMNSVTQKGSVTLLALLSLSASSILSAVVTYSRASVVVLLVPIVLGMYIRSRELNSRAQSVVPLIIILIPLTLIILVLVSALRIKIFGGADLITRSAIDFYVLESIGLFVDRWIGAESLMVSVSSDQSLDLFFRMLVEDQTIGVQGIYQYLANSQYLQLFLENMTFLTLPGAFALLSFSGSFVLVFLGVLIIGLFGRSIEKIVVITFPGNYPLHYLISGNLAYTFSQVVFPQLLIPYVIQLLFVIIILRLFLSKIK